LTLGEVLSEVKAARGRRREEGGGQKLQSRRSEASKDLLEE